MRKRTPDSLQEYFEIISYRRWWLLIPIVVIAVATFFGSLFLPRSYRSEATIIVEPPKVPSNYVQPATSTDVADRLQTIRQEILSRSRLRRIITEFNIYRSDKGSIATDEQVELMRQDISVEIVNSTSERSKNNVQALRISYSGPDPGLVQRVTRQLTSLFIEENLRDREQEAEGTTGFLDDQLERMRQSLQEQEKRVQAFKSMHAGELPEQQMANLQLLGQLQALLQTNSDAITRAQQQEKYLDSVLKTIQATQTPQNMKSALQIQYDGKRADLTAAEQRYKSNHPDVIRLKSEVKAIKEQLDAERAKGGGLASGGATPEEIRAQIEGLRDEVAKRSARQVSIENDMRRIQGHVSALPKVEEQLAELTRDYETSRTNYEALLTKRTNSSIAAEMERRAQGEQFRILDPASYPDKPFKPNLLQINFLGILAGVFAGCGLTFLVEINDQTFHTYKDVMALVEKPILASIPWVLSEEERERQRKRYWVWGSVAGVAFVCMMLAAYILRSSIMSGFGWRF